MLLDLLKDGFGEEEHYNCAEKILYGSNEVYNLGLDRESLKMATGFGGGMGIESVCGALTAAVMVLGKLYGRDYPEEGVSTRELSKEFLTLYEREMGNINCGPLKESYRTEEYKCRAVVLKAAEILDILVKREGLN